MWICNIKQITSKGKRNHLLEDDVCRKRGLVIKVAVIFLPFDKHGYFDAGLNLFRLFCADA